MKRQIKVKDLVSEGIDIYNRFRKKISEDFSREYLNEQHTVNVNIWYHGSKEKFDKFKLKNGTLFDINYKSPIFLTSNVEFAKYYAGNYSPYIYKVKVLTDNILDFRELPSTYDLLMYYEKNKINTDIKVKYYEIGQNLLDYIEDKFHDDDIDRKYNNLLDGDYSSIEQTWVYDWLKLNNYDGAYIIETKELNLLIFDDSKIKILSFEALL
jgi:hypothetical protein